LARSLQPVKLTVARVCGWRASRRAKYLERKHRAGRSGSSDGWNHHVSERWLARHRASAASLQ